MAPILDRREAGIPGPDAALRVVQELIGGPVLKRTPVKTPQALVRLVSEGCPVVLTAMLPEAPTKDGYLPLNGPAGRRRMTVTVLTYNKKRDAVRLTPSLGVGWGQWGRAWLQAAALRDLLATGGDAWAPAVGTPQK